MNESNISSLNGHDMNKSIFFVYEKNQSTFKGHGWNQSNKKFFFSFICLLEVKENKNRKRKTKEEKKQRFTKASKQY